MVFGNAFLGCSEIITGLQKQLFHSTYSPQSDLFWKVFPILGTTFQKWHWKIGVNSEKVYQNGEGSGSQILGEMAKGSGCVGLWKRWQEDQHQISVALPHRSGRLILYYPRGQEQSQLVKTTRE